jgi:hypothetical protein
MQQEDITETNLEFELIKALYISLLYLLGGEEHNPYLADPYPERPNSHRWHSKETFTHLSSYIKPSWELLNALEDEEWIEQPQKFKKWHQQNYVVVTKEGMRKAIDILDSLPLQGIAEALDCRNHHHDYLQHKNKIELMAEQEEVESQEQTDEVN